jgi:hypothetical protein
LPRRNRLTSQLVSRHRAVSRAWNYALCSLTLSFLVTATSTDHYLYGRLTEFASEKMSSLQSALPTITSGDEDEWEMSDNDEEIDMHDPDGIRDDGDNVFLESDDEDDDEVGIANAAGAPIDLQRRIPIGPPQDCDVKPVKRVPPQVMLARAENTLHSLTFGLSMDKLFHTSLAVGKRLSGGAVPSPESSARDLPDVDARSSRRKKRSLLDDFDKRLGLRTRSKNPVVGITSSFLGPIMRMFRIFLIATRVVFNIGVWKDPFLSFWVLCFLVALMLILLVFPWRSFMFMSGLVCFGPQVRLVPVMFLMLLDRSHSFSQMCVVATFTLSEYPRAAKIAAPSRQRRQGAASCRHRDCANGRRFQCGDRAF